jgi:hypothetical protein
MPQSNWIARAAWSLMACGRVAMAEPLIDGIDREQAEHIAASLEELQLKLNGTAFNEYRLAILCGAAAVRAIGGVRGTYKDVTSNAEKGSHE